jgi:drug/metabolite transporter (DMT)-like permease
VAKSDGAIKVLLFSVLALICFAANSILCRLALQSRSIDPASFTIVRLAAGAIILSLIVFASRKQPQKEGNWISGVMLFAYAIAFSYAYLRLSAGTGALLLFGAVQATMITGSMISKKSPTIGQWAGLILALAGLTYLLLPHVSSPPPQSAALMAVAGMAWGIYSIRGSGGNDPVAATTGNFLRAAPLAIVPIAMTYQHSHTTPHGVVLAVISGAITSGLGYVFWYTALPSLGAVRAAVVQLTVPALAALGGVLFLGETLTQRLTMSAVVILSGVAVAVFTGKGSK